MTSSQSQYAFVFALYQTDINIYEGIHLKDLIEVFTERQLFDDQLIEDNVTSNTTWEGYKLLQDTIYVNNNADLTISSSSNVVVTGGLVVESGCDLIISSNSNFYIHDGASIVIEDGGSITLNDTIKFFTPDGDDEGILDITGNGAITSRMLILENFKINIDDYWKRGEVIHFIGKDITYFHFLFWPAVLMNSGFSLPDHLVVHGFLTVNKEKMSKSRGTFITAREYLKVLEPEYLRFYYAANLTHTMTDIDLDMKDFKTRINNELVADLGNFEYRSLSFINKNFDSKLSEIPEDEEAGKLIVECNQKFKEIKEAYENYNFREAVKLILEVGSKGNKYFQENEPWKMVHESEEKKIEAQKILTLCANLAKNISILMKPILPLFSSKTEDTFGLGDLTWDDLGFELKNTKIKTAEILIKKLQDEPEQLIATDESKDKKEKGKKDGKNTKEAEHSKDLDPFAKLDLRVAKILTVEKHPDADKLFIETIDLGKELGERQIVSGLAPYYKPEELEGKNVIVVANLKPAKMRGVMSEGMLLAGEEGDDVVVVLEAPGAEPGDKIYVEGIESRPVKVLDYKDFMKAKMTINEHDVVYKGKPLKAKGDTISVADIKDGIVA